MEVMLAWYSAKNLDETRKFYTDVLGLDKTFEMQGWAEFGKLNTAKAGAQSGTAVGATIGISTGPNSGREPGATVVLKVENVEAERKRLESRGVKFDGPTEEVMGAVRIATFRDPNGNRLQLCQVLMQG
jgi:predicted enzyme related to lactoylglutathione lyase